MKQKLTHQNRTKEKGKRPRKGTRNRHGCRDPLACSHTQEPCKNTRMEAIIYVHWVCGLKREENLQIKNKTRLKRKRPDMTSWDKEPPKMPLSPFSVGQRPTLKSGLLLHFSYAGGY